MWGGKHPWAYVKTTLEKILPEELAIKAIFVAFSSHPVALPSHPVALKTKMAFIWPLFNLKAYKWENAENKATFNI